MTDPGWAAHVALYDALAAGLSVPVYDDTDEAGDKPYVTMDSQTATSFDPLNSRRDERFFYIHVWSVAPGQKEVLDILAEIDAAAHQQRLSMSNGRWVQSFVTRKDTSRDSDGKTYMGRATVRVITEH